MASRKIEVRGIEVSLWKATFQLPGMKQVFWPGSITEETVKELITAIYDAVENQAIESGKRKLVASVAAKTRALLDE